MHEAGAEHLLEAEHRSPEHPTILTTREISLLPFVDFRKLPYPLATSTSRPIAGSPVVPASMARNALSEERAGGSQGIIDDTTLVVEEMSPSPSYAYLRSRSFAPRDISNPATSRDASPVSAPCEVPDSCSDLQSVLPVDAQDQTSLLVVDTPESLSAELSPICAMADSCRSPIRPSDCPWCRSLHTTRERSLACQKKPCGRSVGQFNMVSR